jgi:hypothetical protein
MVGTARPEHSFQVLLFYYYNDATWRPEMHTRHDVGCRITIGIPETLYFKANTFQALGVWMNAMLARSCDRTLAAMICCGQILRVMGGERLRKQSGTDVIQDRRRL